MYSTLQGLLASNVFANHSPCNSPRKTPLLETNHLLYLSRCSGVCLAHHLLKYLPNKKAPMLTSGRISKASAGGISSLRVV